MISEISFIIFFIVYHYLDLSKVKIVLIFKNRFKSENIYKFSHLKDYKDKDRDKNIIFQYSQMKINKITSTLRDFGNTINI